MIPSEKAAINYSYKVKSQTDFVTSLYVLNKTHCLVPDRHTKRKPSSLGMDFTVAYSERYGLFAIYKKLQAISFGLHIVFNIFLLQSARYHGRSRMDYSWDEAVSNLCHGANVYRFVTIDTGVMGNISNNASKCATVGRG